MSSIWNSIEQFTVAERGLGSLGSKLLLAKDKSTETPYAVRLTDITELETKTGDPFASKTMLHYVKQEYELVSSLNHPNIVRVFGTFREIDSNTQHELHYIVMEFFPQGDLSRYLKVTKLPVPEFKLQTWFRQLLSAVKFIHDRGIIHRDIKPATIFLSDDTNSLILSDFGIARKLNLTLNQSNTCVGTVAYMSPELIRGENYGAATDVWSLGVTFYETANACQLFTGSTGAMFSAITSKQPAPFSADRGYSQTCSDFVMSIIEQKDQTRRPTISELLAHDFMTKKIVNAEPSDKRDEEVRRLRKLANRYSGESQLKDGEIIKLKETIRELEKQRTIAENAFNHRSEYDVIQELGSGGFGNVMLVSRKIDKAIFAIKTVNLTKIASDHDETMGAKLIAMASREAANMATFLHPNIVRVFGSFEQTINGDKFYHMVMEYCKSGDLAKVIRTRRIQRSKNEANYFDEPTIRNWMGQLVSVLAYLHSRQVVHRDIKPGNIFVSETQDTLKLGDFGLAKEIAQVSKTFAITVLYTAPEIVDPENPASHTPKCDVWSLGIVLYELAYLDKPFYGQQMFEAMRAIRKDTLQPLPECYGKDIRDLVAKMLDKNPSKRLSSDQIIEHPFMKSYYSKN